MGYRLHLILMSQHGKHVSSDAEVVEQRLQKTNLLQLLQLENEHESGCLFIYLFTFVRN